MKSPLSDVAPVLAGEDHPVWQFIHPEIQPHEFNRPWHMDAAFLELLGHIRRESGVPFRFRSDRRLPSQGVGVSNSAHHEYPCRAVDLRVFNSWERGALIVTAARNGIVRIGVYPDQGDGHSSVHLDASTRLPSPRIWTRF